MISIKIHIFEEKLTNKLIEHESYGIISVKPLPDQFLAIKLEST